MRGGRCRGDDAAHDLAVCLITRTASANQAAITDRVGSKDGLYREVLRAAVTAFEDQSLITEAAVTELDRVEALRLVIRQFLLPLHHQQGRRGSYVRIFGREGFDPSPVYAAFFAEETPQVFILLEHLVRRFLPVDASPRRIALTAFWLMQQPTALINNARRLPVRPTA